MAKPYWNRRVALQWGDPKEEGALDGDAWGVFWCDPKKGKRATIHLRPHLRRKGHRFDLWETLLHEVGHIVLPRAWHRNTSHHSAEFYRVVSRLTKLLYKNPHLLQVLASHRPTRKKQPCDICSKKSRRSRSRSRSAARRRRAPSSTSR